jgi:hypothetical protein
VPGTPIPARAVIPEGNYTLSGAVSGTAKVSITHNADHSAIATVAVAYDNHSDERDVIFNGTERVTQTRPALTEWQLTTRLRTSGMIGPRRCVRFQSS